MVELVDLYPTLAELAGLETPPGLEGRSLVPLMEDPQRDWKPAAFSQLSLGRVLGRSVRTEDWRSTEWSGDQQAVELFEYRSLGTESINHATDPAYADVRRRMAALLQ